MAYDETNRGAAWPNDKKGNARAPDFRGYINVEGKEYWASFWVKIAGAGSKNPGQKFLSYNIEAKEQDLGSDPLSDFGGEVETAVPVDDLSPPKFPEIPEDDDIPF